MLTSDPADPWATLRRSQTGTEVYLYSQLPSIHPVSLKSTQLIYHHSSGTGCLAGLDHQCLRVCVCVCLCVEMQRNNPGKTRSQKLKATCPQTVCKKNFFSIQNYSSHFFSLPSKFMRKRSEVNCTFLSMFMECEQ